MTRRAATAALAPALAASLAVTGQATSAQAVGLPGSVAGMAISSAGSYGAAAGIAAHRGSSNKAKYKRYARKFVGGGRQYRCLVKLWNKESGWNVHADNPTSSAYGIPQALPGRKMGRGWRTSYKVQIRWGVRYIEGRYGSPCAAWAHSQRHNWY